MTFGDGFAGAAGAGLDTGKYRYVTGPGTSFGSGEVETMTDSTQNLFYDGNGHLLIRALHAGTVPATGWTSARFETNAATFGAEKGGVVRVQVAIAQPDLNKQTGAGYWPAVRMIGSDLRTGGVWPQVGEIGIIEDVNGRGSAFGALHCGVNPGGPCNEANGLGSGEHACAGCQNGFHVYAVEIDRSKSPESIRWYVDGVNYFTVAQDRVDPTTWAAAVDHSFFLVFNLSMAGSFPAAYGGGPYPATVSGGTMRIGYVAVYNKR